jgi:mRNA-decapping enzyme subunit 2
MQQIPSNGALIFNKNMDKLFFLIYSNPRDRIPNKLDFPKGKVDQGESQLECAVREIYEETGLTLTNKIDEQHAVKIETIRNRVVKLFVISGIDEKPYKPVKTKEVKQLEWIPVGDYISETLMQNSLEAIVHPPY